MSPPGECVPLWYRKGYTLGHVASELRRNGYSEDDAARRVVEYARWLQVQEPPAPAARMQPSR